MFNTQPRCCVTIAWSLTTTAARFGILHPFKCNFNGGRVMPKSVTSNKTTAKASDTKKAVAAETKAVVSTKKKAPLTAPSPALATAAPKAVAKTAAQKNTISIMPEHTEPTSSAAKTTESIAARAYLLWEEGGCQHGRHEEYWLEAEKLLKSKAQK
jgi:hypothetical protein